MIYVVLKPFDCLSFKFSRKLSKNLFILFKDYYEQIVNVTISIICPLPIFLYKTLYFRTYGMYH